MLSGMNAVTTRRGFLAGTGALFALSAAGVGLKMLPPMAERFIWGDGKHDDTAALNRLLAGEDIYHVADVSPAWVGGGPGQYRMIDLSRGYAYRITNSLVFPKGSRWIALVNGKFYGDGLPRGAAFVDVEGEGCFLGHNTFIGGNSLDDCSAIRIEHDRSRIVTGIEI